MMILIISLLNYTVASAVSLIHLSIWNAGKFRQNDHKFLNEVNVRMWKCVKDRMENERMRKKVNQSTDQNRNQSKSKSVISNEFRIAAHTPVGYLCMKCKTA